MLAAHLTVPDPADPAARAAWAADCGLAAALEAVGYAVSPDVVRRAGEAGARAAGAKGVALTVEVDRLRDGGGLEKSELVRLWIDGRTDGHPFRAARTTIVGYDTLPDQIALGHEALRALRVAMSVLRTGGDRQDLRLAGLSVLQSAGWTEAGNEVVTGRLDPIGLLDERAESTAPDLLTAGEVLWIGVKTRASVAGATEAGGRSHAIHLAEMVRVGADGPDVLTRLSRRLWL